MFQPGPNSLAYAALLLWPIIMWALFKLLGPARGLTAGLISGYLLLPPAPAGINLPVLPLLDKTTIPSMAALVLCLTMYRPQIALLPVSRAPRILLAMLLLGPVATVLGNLAPVLWGSTVISSHKLSDVIAVILNQLFLVTPFVLGRALLADDDRLRDLCLTILIAALAYSLPMLLEIRLSPQINTWIYGFFQHSFEQMMREGGFRPLVFLYHGLWAAFFAMTGLLASCALLREDGRARKLTLAASSAWMLMVLVLCKSLASLIYGVISAPIILFASVRLQVHLAALAAVLALAYPLARGADLVPVQGMLAAAERVDPARAQSLQFRFENEQVLLDHANKRQPFGWGMWGRHLVYEAQSGKPVTISDGRWIIVLGTFGWIGYIAEFGLISFSIFLSWWRVRAGAPRIVGALALILAVNLVDLIPNATLTPLTWLFAGALLGWAERRDARVAPKALPATSREPAFQTVL